MGFASLDQLVNAVTVSSQFYRAEWNKLVLPTTAQVAGEWYTLMTGQGQPTAQSLFGTGTNLKFQATSDSTVGASGIQHGGNVSTATKHALNASAYTAAATTVPCLIMLIDILGFYPITTVTTTGDQTLDNTVVFPTGRQTNGQGLRCFVTPSTVMGAATPNIRITYTNQAGAAGQLTPGTLPVGKTASPVGAISYSGTGVGKYGPFMPLAQGDSGIQSIQKFNLSATYVSGVLNLVVCRPLFTIPITTIGVAGERDFLNQIPSLPRIFDGACLGLLIYAGAATPVNSAFFGHVDFGWN